MILVSCTFKSNKTVSEKMVLINSFKKHLIMGFRAIRKSRNVRNENARALFP